MTRREAGRELARRVSDRVAAVAPPGLGRWEGAWKIVEEPSRRFLEVLDHWERTEDAAPGLESRLRDDVRRSADDLVNAWVEAAQQWETEGRPETWSRGGTSTADQAVKASGR